MLSVEQPIGPLNSGDIVYGASMLGFSLSFSLLILRRQNPTTGTIPSIKGLRLSPQQILTISLTDCLSFTPSKAIVTVAVIKSNKDTRYGLDSIVTHDGMKLPCWALANLSSFRQKIGPDAYDQLDVIGIDEAQFFEDLYDFCCEAADHDGKTVIVAGLDGDYLRRSFGSVVNIIPLANSVTKLTARCELCGKRAFFTLRKTDETETELIGGAEVYMPVCRQHYVDGQVAIGAARSVLESKKLECGTCA
ncbi:hypothetical protein Goshw_018348 [Gossypium schwendimanii]|uniref:Thymidine kinase n=1 Tax=Gossypium schwendimanii TaxID=34291 RepID=A0A7J9MCB0_GOSSC|nr:hypothetical protein [Gossypium schwendimanii]